MADQSNSPPSQGDRDDPPRQISTQNLERPPNNRQGPSDASSGQRSATGAQVGQEQQLSPTTAQMAANLPGIVTYWDNNPYHQQQYLTPQSPSGLLVPESPIDPNAFQNAIPPSWDTSPGAPLSEIGTTPIDAYEGTSYFEDQNAQDSDRIPLTSTAQPIDGLSVNEDGQVRDSFQTIRSDTGSVSQQDVRADLERGTGSQKLRSFGRNLTADDAEGIGRRRSRSSPTSGALLKAGSIVRAMSQRVVNISGEAEVLENQKRRQRSRSPSADTPREPLPPIPQIVDTSYPSQLYQNTQSPTEKRGQTEYVFPSNPGPLSPVPGRMPGRMPNFLKGKSLGIFSPDNSIRLWLCDFLVQPWTEPLILILIVLQTILLCVEAAPSVFDQDGNGSLSRWGSNPIDWAILVLFVIYTLEVIARVIVSGFILNAAEYSTIDRARGVKAAVAEKYRDAFSPQRQKSVKKPPQENYGPSTLSRSVTWFHGERLPETVEEQQRYQLARRAFLRHGFNRLDFVAVVSFWVLFVISITGIEALHHLYLFRMLSSLRILRLLALTKGNAVILRSLKKAAPLLLRVSFLIGFFWVVFAIIGVQSFKSSFSRQCVWLDPTDPFNASASYTQDMQFCGGYLNESTGKQMPWLIAKEYDHLNDFTQGTASAKGYICPKGTLCLQRENPYNNTVHFDDILHSLELVFVVMSANTFSDLMYYTINSDYSPAALFFGAGIMIMMLWMINLLIAVITSSFQVIREESKASAFTDVDDHALEDTETTTSTKITSLQRLYNKTKLFWILCITVDLVSQACKSASMPPPRLTIINAVEIVVTILLDIEMIIRVLADHRNFRRHKRNMVDLGIAIITTIILLPPIQNSTEAYAWLTVFQILRVYRVVLAVPMTAKLIKLVLGDATGISNLMLFVFLITLLMSIFASQLFRGQVPLYDDGGDNINISFNTIWNSFLGMYQILSTENWTDLLYTVTAYTTAYETSWIGAIFLISWFILAFFILVNMFIAVIQENFDVSEDVKRLEQVKAFLQRKELGANSSNLALSTIFSFGRTRRKKDPLDYGPAMMEMLLKEAVVRDFLDDRPDASQENLPNESLTPPDPNGAFARQAVKPGMMSTVWGKLVTTFTSKDPNPFYSNIRFEAQNEALDPRQMAQQAVSASADRRKAQRAYLARHPTYNNALYIFTPRNSIRRLCQRIVGPGRGNERFDGVEPNKTLWYSFSAFIYAAIVAMVILACVTTPLYQKEYFDAYDFSVANWFVWTDAAFAILFSVEAVIKVIADGFFWTPNAYFRSSWGIIDAVVLITLWINVITLFKNDGAVSRAVGAFKALRALRLLNVSDSARDTFHSLIVVGWWKIMSAAFVSLSLIIPFAIYGLNLFAGKMVICNDGDAGDFLYDCYGEYSSAPFNWDVLAPRVADNPYYSFDDFPSSLFILFQIVSQEGWVDVSFSAQAITGIGMQPQFGASTGNAVFFVIYNLLGTVFVLNLFISVFMRNYTEQTGVAYLTAEQRSWLELRKLLRQISPSKNSYDESKRKWKKWCHRRAIEKRGKWHTAITVLLILHLVLLLVEFASEPEWWTYTRDSIFFVFTLIFMANICVRIFGLGWPRFRKSSWDMYSVVAVSGAFATTILFLAQRQVDTYTQLHKFFLVTIIFLLIPRNDALDQLFKTAAASLTTIGNLLATWLVFFLVFAIALTQTFSLTRFGGSEDNNVNFRTVPNALLLLFRMSVGEGWNQIMEDFAAIEPPLCVDSELFFESDCGSSEWARVLFILWNIVSMYIFVNLFVSLIFESFSYVYQRHSGSAAVDRDEMRRFKEAWRSVDPRGTGYISKEAFPRLLGELSGVFEMRIYQHENSVHQIMEDVRNENPGTRHASISTVATNAYGGISIDRLNQRLDQIDVVTVRERRRKYNIFYEEVMVSADPDKGISFTTVLMILAHYNIINDSKSLRLEEFLRRRARLQRVEEEVRRRVVVGFFDTMYHSRKFKRHMALKRSARMTAVPQLDLPDILVDDEEDRAAKKAGTAHSSTSLSPIAPGTESLMHSLSSFLSPTRDGTGSVHRKKLSSTSADLTLQTSFDAFNAHPLSMPRTGGGNGEGPLSPLSQRSSSGGGGGLASFDGHQSTHSAFSFELQASGSGTSSRRTSYRNSNRNSRSNSAVSPIQMSTILDDSIWVESIRRSATMKRPQQKW
ncbi:calcium-channel protein cch1 [Coniella lustricola]|uniref:Calcium-channel protein CCH1 n=1 Tax=Coniella lustricola TaxID=2025994 RepID=A0A2T3A2E0_9PEZI|nr:calcium-channel protein cch1 [Coniella lustricola]